MLKNQRGLDSPLRARHSPRLLPLPADRQSPPPVLSHQHSDLQLLGKWPHGFWEGALAAQRTSEVGGRCCGAEEGAERQDAAGWRQISKCQEEPLRLPGGDVWLREEGRSERDSGMWREAERETRRQRTRWK